MKAKATLIFDIAGSGGLQELEEMIRKAPFTLIRLK